jgi:hypothetical protein
MTRNVSSITRLIALGVLTFAAAACEAQKSENPLSPNVAGPIAGVAISVPAPVAPAAGAEIVNTEPLRLVFENATSNGVRPVWYVVEVAGDASFTNKVYTNGKVMPAEGPRTTLVVDAKLNAEATYFWRVRAEDGANNSDYSAAVHFDIVVPVSIGAPSPASPANGSTTANNHPDLTVTNGSVTGRAGNVEYRFQVALDQAFASVVAAPSAGRGGGGTTTVATPELIPNTQYFWRAFGTNGSVTSGMSAVHTFRTPAPAGGGGGGGGGNVPPPPAGGGRAPDPAPGQRLPLPNMSAVVQQVAAQFPAALRNSCQDDGGTWEFMDRLVNELRRYDTRWGYNGKRGNVNDPSKDVVDYHWGRGADENSTEVYIIDVIVGHCGGNPQPGWGDVTDVTAQGGSIGRWTSRGRF